jgi:GNAT superfamily N-acetyltransferase
MGSANLHGYTITDDPAAVDRDQLFEWLTTDAYWWSGGLTRVVLDAALETSLCLSALSPSRAFVGFGRMVTDRATFAYWCDVYVMPEHRGKGLGRQLTRIAVEHPALATCRRIMLATRDAHQVYERLGFHPLDDPSWFMEVNRPSAAAPCRSSTGSS